MVNTILVQQQDRNEGVPPSYRTSLVNAIKDKAGQVELIADHGEQVQDFATLRELDSAKCEVAEGAAVSFQDCFERAEGQGASLDCDVRDVKLGRSVAASAFKRGKTKGACFVAD